MMVRTKIFVKEDTKMLYTEKEKHEIERVKEASFTACVKKYTPTFNPALRALVKCSSNMGSLTRFPAAP